MTRGRLGAVGGPHPARRAEKGVCGTLLLAALFLFGVSAAAPPAPAPAVAASGVPPAATPPSATAPTTPPPPPRLPPLPPVEPVTPLPYAQYREEAFEAAQWAFRTEAAVALDRLAARFAAGGDEVGRLERELQAATAAWRAAQSALSDSYSRPGPEAEEQRNGLRDRAEQLDRQVQDVLGRIQSRFPAYSELVRPRAYGLETIRALLKPDEALLLIVNADDATYLFAITSERYEWFRSADLPRAEVESAVTALRSSLVDTIAGSGEASASRLEGPPPFDRALAHRLYRGLVGPAEPLLAGKSHLITVTSGELATLPLNLLVTQPVLGDGRDGDLTGTHWLADRFVLATLPSVSSLIALRCILSPGAARPTACPVESGIEAREAVTLPQALAAAGAPVLLGSAVETRGAAAPTGELFGQRQLADPEYLRRRYAPLRGARRELQSIRGQYGRRATILLGADATERAVKEKDAFRTARYVVFSTHGVLAVRPSSYGEPGLVFTPPAAGAETDLDDGFLGASEVAQLRFNAEFVVLSACDTAASGEGPGGEGLSGLARAFLFAGARSLLVSHWQVDDRATSILISRAFRSLDEESGGKGAALKRAMSVVRRDRRFSHPRYWAAFTLVGDPR